MKQLKRRSEPQAEHATEMLQEAELQVTDVRPCDLLEINSKPPDDVTFRNATRSQLKPDEKKIASFSFLLRSPGQVCLVPGAASPPRRAHSAPVRQASYRDAGLPLGLLALQTAGTRASRPLSESPTV